MLINAVGNDVFKKTVYDKLVTKVNAIPNGHIFVDSQSIQRRNSTWEVGRDFIDFEKRIHVEIMTSIWRGNLNVDSTFKVDEKLMSFPRGFFYVVWMSNRRNCFNAVSFLSFSNIFCCGSLFYANLV